MIVPVPVAVPIRERGERLGSARFPRAVLCLPFLLLAGCFAGCITVVINFPEAAVEDAADRIIDEVRPELEEESAAPEGDAAEEGSTDDAVAAPRSVRSRTRLIALALPATAGPAAGDDEEKGKKKDERDGDKRIDIDLDDPVIARIRASLKKRYAELLPFYRKGALGERLDGLVEARPEEAELTLKEKRDLESLVKAENRDRMNLYKRIVATNDEIEESQIGLVQGIFGKRWIAQCKKGWWIQVRDPGDRDGKDGEVRWTRKPEEPPEEKKDGSGETAPGRAASPAPGRPTRVAPAAGLPAPIAVASPG